MIRASQLGWQTNNTNLPNEPGYMAPPPSSGFGLGSLNRRPRATSTWQPAAQSLTATLAALARGGLSALTNPAARNATPKNYRDPGPRWENGRWSNVPNQTGGGRFWGLPVNAANGVRASALPSIQPGRLYS